MDDVRRPEFEIDDGEDARAHGRTSAQSGRVEFITRGDRRRVWAVEQKRAIALESLDPGTTPTEVARRYGITSGLLYTWRRQLREGQLGSAPQPIPGFGFARVDLVADRPRLEAPEPVQPLSSPQPPTPAAPTPPHAGLIEIALPGGASVRVDASVDGAALRRVLAALERR